MKKQQKEHNWNNFPDEKIKFCKVMSRVKKLNQLKY